MRDGASLAALCEQLASQAGLSVGRRQFHALRAGPDDRLRPHIGVLLLAESHLAGAHLARSCER